MKILFSGGGTLGSVTPLIAASEEIHKLAPEAKFVWVGTRTGVERSFVAKQGIPYRWICSGKLRRYFDLRNVLDIFSIAIGFVQSFFMLIFDRPSAVVVAGSFVQVPLVFAARVLGIPVVLHQEDVEVGLANRLSRSCATAITLTFAESGAAFGARTVSVIGNPARHAIIALTDPATHEKVRTAARARWGFSPEKPCLLVIGGGTGAAPLNDHISRIAPVLTEWCSILHLTGKGKGVKPPLLSKERVGVRYLQFELLTDAFPEAVAVADLAITRAGLGTLTELGCVGVPMLIVPLPGHQQANAKLLAARGAGIILDTAASDRVWTDTIRALLHDRDRRSELSRASAALFPADASLKLARIILEVAE